MNGNEETSGRKAMRLALASACGPGSTEDGWDPDDGYWSNGRPLECRSCPFATLPRSASSGDGYCRCDHLGRDVWGENPPCEQKFWDALARDELKRLKDIEKESDTQRRLFADAILDSAALMQAYRRGKEDTLRLLFDMAGKVGKQQALAIAADWVKTAERLEPGAVP